MSVMLMAAASAAAAVTSAAGTPQVDQATDLTRSSSGYVYFNRPGADLALHNAEVKDCLQRVTGSGPSESGYVGVIPGLMEGLQSSQSRAANVENCMVVKGWRVVKLTDTEGAAVSSLDRAGKSTQLQGWVGLTDVHGEVVRQWDNDAARSATHKYKLPGYFGRTSLSVAALPDEEASPPKPVEPPKLPKKLKSANWPKALKPAEYSTIPTGFGLVLLHLKGLGMSSTQGFFLNRVSPEPDRPAWAVDQLPEQLILSYASLSVGAGGKSLAYALPPGRWRFTSMVSGASFLNLCLGSPAFEVKPGDVLYLGAFDTRADYLGPLLSMEEGKALLADQPALQSKLRPANYVNGTTAKCAGNFTYALEVRGAPYESGYAWGGAAPALPPLSSRPVPTSEAH